jgi:hypothetical protein
MLLAKQCDCRLINAVSSPTCCSGIKPTSLRHRTMPALTAASCRLQCGIVPTSLRHHADSIAASCRLHCGIVPWRLSLRHHADFTAASCRLHCGIVPCRLSLRYNTMPTLFRLSLYCSSLSSPCDMSSCGVIPGLWRSASFHFWHRRLGPMDMHLT